jgi:hypothetical protein
MGTPHSIRKIHVSNYPGLPDRRQQNTSLRICGSHRSYEWLSRRIWWRAVQVLIIHFWHRWLERRSCQNWGRYWSCNQNISRSWWRCSICICRYLDMNRNQNQTLDQGSPPALLARNWINWGFGYPKQLRLCHGQHFDTLALI